MLTQAEIDALLSGAIDSGNAADEAGHPADPQPGQHEERHSRHDKLEEIRPYNFWSPDRFSKEQMRAVEVMHEDLAERLTTSLPPFLRVNLKPRVVFTEQGRFHDLLRDLEPGGLFHLLSLPPLPGQIVLTISSVINHVILEKRLGSRSEIVHQQKNFTDIDQLILRAMIEHILPDIQACWGKVSDVEPCLEDSTTNYHWVQMTMGNERVMLVALELVFKDATGTMNIYIPFSTLKPISNQLNPHAWISGSKERHSDADTRQNALRRLANINVPVRVVLGNAGITLGDLAGLQAGDVIPLITPIYQDLPVQVVNRTRFLARAGRVGNRLAAQITSIINPFEQVQGIEEPAK